jgi:hypothetical protein
VRAWRWPARLFVPALLVAGLVVDSTIDRTEVELEVIDQVETEVVIPAASVLTSTWMCPTVVARWIGDSGVEMNAELLITNLGEEPTRASVQLLSPTSAPVTTTIDLPARGSRTVNAVELLDSELVSALIESPSGAVAVSRLIHGHFGVDVSPCSTLAADEWYMPAGDTLRDAVTEIVLYNPFSSDAVVDLTFATNDEIGEFSVAELEGVVVHSRSVQRVDLTEHVRVREAVGTIVRARAGQVVVDQLVTLDGTQERTGMSVSLATASLAQRWTYPAGFVDDLVTMRVHIVNPSDEVAEIDVAADTGPGGGGDPVALTVGPRDSVVLPVVGFLEEAPESPMLEVAPGNDFGLIVESANEVPVAVAVEVSYGLPRTGLIMVPATASLASEWFLQIPPVEGALAQLAVHNHGSSDQTVTITDLAGVEVGRLEMRPSSTQVIEVPAGSMLEVVSDGPISVMALLTRADQLGVAGVVGIAR